MKIFCVTNQKGGVGKTAIACHLAFYLADLGKKVLFIDLDPQANATKTLKAGLQAIVASQFMTTEINAIVQREGITLIGADGGLSDIERASTEVIKTFKKNVDRLTDYDFVIIDTPPTLGMRVSAALIVADYVVSPIKPEGYSIDGITKMLQAIVGVQQKYNPKLQFLGMIPCLVKGNSPDHKAALGQLTSRYPQYMLLGAAIGDRQSIDEALNKSIPVWKIDKTAAKAASKEMKTAFELIGQKIGGF